MAEARMLQGKDSVAKFKQELLAKIQSEITEVDAASPEGVRNVPEDGVVDDRDVERAKRDDRWLLSFLAATKNDIPAATRRLLATMAWRRDMDVNDLEGLHAQIRPEFFKACCAFCRYKDKKGRPIVWTVPARYQQLETDCFQRGNMTKADFLDQSKKFYTFMVENLLNAGTSLCEHFTVIVDMTDVSFWKIDLTQMEFAKWDATTSNAHYPNTIANILIVHLNPVLASLAKFVLSFFHEDTRDATKFVGAEGLVEYVEAEYLPEHMGGTDQTWHHLQDLPAMHGIGGTISAD